MPQIHQFPTGWVYNQIVNRQDFIFEATDVELRFQNFDADFPNLAGITSFNLPEIISVEQTRALLNLGLAKNAMFETIHLLQLMVHVQGGIIAYSRPAAPNGLWTVDVRF